MLEPILNFINIEAVAQRMGKSRPWLSQRIHGHKVNNKVATFSPDERALFKKTLKEIAGEIIIEADKL